jgi:hypothetical protein
LDSFKAALEAPVEYTFGWNKDKNGWWYAASKTTYYKSCWQIINGHKYYFNKDGYAVTNWQVIDGKDYYFEPRAGQPLECALYVSGIGRVDDDSVSNYFKLLHTINCTRQLLLYITPTKWAPAI